MMNGTVCDEHHEMMSSVHRCETIQEDAQHPMYLVNELGFCICPSASEIHGGPSKVQLKAVLLVVFDSLPTVYLPVPAREQPPRAYGDNWSC
jgi:hypothetical protein